MSQLFMGKTALKTQYFEATSAQVTAATSLANAHCLGRVGQASRIALIANGTSADVRIYLVHPDADPAVLDFRHLLVELPANTPLNLDTSFGMSLAIDPGTWMFVHIAAGSVAGAREKVRCFLWG